MKREVSQAIEMSAHVECWINSDLSQRAFCEQHQIKPHVFYYWLRRYRSKQASLDQKGFIPVSVTPVKQIDTPGIEVLGVNGNRILFHDPVDPAYLKSLLL